MKTLTKIMLFVVILTLGMVVIDTTLAALRHPCYCRIDTDAEVECTLICFASYEVECLIVYPVAEGCEFGDCITTWKFYCENNARGYIDTSAPFCSDCDWF